jgi:hypothetical protein
LSSGDFDIDEWLEDGKLHLQHHPAAVKGGNDSFIKTYSRTKGFSYVSLMTYDHDERCYIFDALHGAPACLPTCLLAHIPSCPV